MSTGTETPPHVLVVDDDRAVRESLRRSLEFNGYAVTLASDGAEALATIAGRAPDALVIDVMMPRLDGIETTRALRTAGNDLPILVLTARDSVGDRVEGLDAGADDYLTKPFALDELLARLRALLRRVHQSGSDELEAELLTFADLTLNPTGATAPLSFYEELAAREIADVMGFPSQFHVYRRLRSVLALLARRLPRAYTGDIH